MHWHNTARLRGYLGDLPGMEFQQLFSAEPNRVTDLMGP